MCSYWYYKTYPDSKVYGANMGPTLVLLAPGGPHVGPMNIAINITVRGIAVAAIIFILTDVIKRSNSLIYVSLREVTPWLFFISPLLFKS